MALSGVTYVSDGVTRDFTISFALGYLSEEHVRAWVHGELYADGSKYYRTLTFLSKERVRIAGSVPPEGVQIEFTRVVPKASDIVSFRDGDALNDDNLTTSQHQAMMSSHEALDLADRVRRDLDKKIDQSIAEIRQEMNGIGERVVFLFVEEEPGTDVPKHHVHIQSEPSTVWVIDHNLDTYPGVTAYDNTGEFLVVEYSFSTKNQMRISLAYPASGVAYVH